MLNLSYASTSYITGVEVRYKTGGYPTDTTDGTGKTVTGTPTSITITGLTNGETYYFRLFLYREIDGVKYYQTSVIKAQTSTMCAIPVPAALKAISATAGDKQVTLSIAYSSTANVSGVEVRYQTGSYPSSATNGSSKTVTGTPTSISITGLANENTYYFRVFPYNEVSGTRYYQTSTTNAQITGKPAAPVPTVRGITPAKTGSNYIVIDTSGSFTLSVPSKKNITVHLVSGGNCGDPGDFYDDTGEGGNGGKSGIYKKLSISLYGNYSCVSTIGAAISDGSTNGQTTTVLTIDSARYSTSAYGYIAAVMGGNGGITGGENGRDGIFIPSYGYVCSSGGAGVGFKTPDGTSGGIGGAGAGDGGELDSSGTNATNYGCGGGGGGGGGFALDQPGSAGDGKPGCIIFEW